MSSDLASGFRDVGSEMKDSLKDCVPDFLKSIETKTNSFEEADKSINKVEGINEKKGGSYKDVYVRGEGEGKAKEVHHMPADGATNLAFNDGPTIKMDKADHRETASWGNSNDARKYQAAQKELIEQGKFKEALELDIDDIHEKFGDKYDDAIEEMLEYVDKLEAEGKI